MENVISMLVTIIFQRRKHNQNKKLSELNVLEFKGKKY